MCALAALVAVFASGSLAGAQPLGTADLASSAATADAGYRDFSFGSTAPAPTAKDPQSKLWFNDGIWWGSLFNSSTLKYQIYRLNGGAQTWSDTGTVIDERDVSRSDALWDGTKLYVVTSGLTSTKSSDNARVLRFSYATATKTYTLDSGFPVTLATGGGMEAVGIEKDTTGKLWVTYTKNQSVYITHSITSDSTWAAPFVLPATESTGLTTQDESAIVSYNSKIGIMWSDQARVPMRYRFATHNDGDAVDVWQSTIALQGTEIADNHMNLKALDGDPAGQVFGVVKTSLNAPNDPLYYVLRLDNSGVWTSYVFGTVADDHTRAQIALDPENRMLYVMATSPCCSGGSVYYKESSLDSISFSPGLGMPFIEKSTDPNINNVSTTKQPLGSSTGLVAVASDDNTNFYLHNALGVGPDTTPPETTITSGPSGTVETSNATFTFTASEPGSTFACSIDDGPFTACASPTTYTGLADGSHTLEVRATDVAGNTDPSPASRTWTIDTTIQSVTLSPDADARVERNNPNTNFGTGAALVVDSSPTEESLVRFSLASVPGSVVSATLRLYVTNGTINGPGAYSADNAWSETGVTWNTKPPRSGSALDDKGPLAIDTWAEFDVTSAAVAGATTTFNLVGTSSDGVEFNSREASVNRPQLVVRYGADATPPDTTIDSGPSGLVNSSSASFTFSSNEPGSTFACSLDEAAFTACTSPKGYSGLADGAHSFQVRATDGEGNTDPSPASRSWTVDTVAPAAPAITSPADGTIQASSTVALAGTAEPVATVELFDGAISRGTTTADASGDWTKTLLGVADGEHSYTAKARDAAGNLSSASAAVTVTVDTTAPETTIDSGPSGTVASSSATFTFSSAEAGASFSCSLDGAAFTACTSPQGYTGLAEGTHNFQVRASDSLGNTDPTPASRTWTVSFGLFSDGFESGNFSAWTTVLTGGDGSASVQGAIVKTGSFAAQLSATANTGSFAYARKTLASPQTDLRVVGDFRILTEGASGGNVPFLRLFDSGGTRIISLYRQNLSGDKVQVGYGGGNFVTTGRLPLNTWGNLELHVIVAGATSTVEVRLDGALVYQSTSANLGTAGVATIQIGNDTARQTFTLVADNIVASVPGSP